MKFNKAKTVSYGEAVAGASRMGRVTVQLGSFLPAFMSLAGNHLTRARDLVILSAGADSDFPPNHLHQGDPGPLANLSGNRAILLSGQVAHD